MLSHVWLLATPWTIAPLSVGFPRQEYRSGLPFHPASSQPRDRTCVSHVSCIGRWIVYHWAAWEDLSISSEEELKLLEFVSWLNSSTIFLCFCIFSLFWWNLFFGRPKWLKFSTNKRQEEDIGSSIQGKPHQVLLCQSVTYMNSFSCLKF